MMKASDFDFAMRELIIDSRTAHVFNSLQNASGMSRQSFISAVASGDVCLGGEVKRLAQDLIADRAPAQHMDER
jgi:hypothetical protein